MVSDMVSHRFLLLCGSVQIDAEKESAKLLKQDVVKSPCSAVQNSTNGRNHISSQVH